MHWYCIISTLNLNNIETFYLKFLILNFLMIVNIIIMNIIQYSLFKCRYSN